MSDLSRCNEIAEKLIGGPVPKHEFCWQIPFFYRGFSCGLQPDGKKIIFNVFSPKNPNGEVRALWKFITHSIGFSADKDYSKILKDIENRIEWEKIAHAFETQETRDRNYKESVRKHIEYREKVASIIPGSKIYGRNDDTQSEVSNNKIVVKIYSETMDVSIKDSSMESLENIVGLIYNKLLV